MFPTPERTRTIQSSAFIAQRLIALLLIYVLILQTLAPPAFAAPKPGFAFAWPNSHSSLLSIFKKPKGDRPCNRCHRTRGQTCNRRLQRCSDTGQHVVRRPRRYRASSTTTQGCGLSQQPEWDAKQL